MPHKNYLPSGIVMCAFSVIIFLAAQDQLDLPALVFIALLFISGVWAVLSSLFKLEQFHYLCSAVRLGCGLKHRPGAFRKLAARRRRNSQAGTPALHHLWKRSRCRRSVVLDSRRSLGTGICRVSTISCLVLEKRLERYFIHPRGVEPDDCQNFIRFYWFFGNVFISCFLAEGL